MKSSSNPSGNIVFTSPDSASEVEFFDSTLPSKRQRRTADTSPPSEMAQIIAAVTADEPINSTDVPKQLQGFKVDVGGAKATRRSREGSSKEPISLDVDVALKANEDVVILIEQDGAYEWHFPEKVTHKKPLSRRRRTAIIETKSAHFSIPIGEGTVRPKRRGTSRGLGTAFTNFVKGKIIGVVLKLVARKTIGALSRRLEKGVDEGPILIASATDLNNWAHEQNYTKVKLPTDRPARVLLLVHGTFSSTKGSFGALTEYQAGQDFLGLALDHYDAVLAYDHYTLADTPKENAEKIFASLDELQQRSNGGLIIDAVSFSRGGLVYRYLTEQIVPGENSLLVFNKAIFVGCTNAGTELANEQNWKTLVDFYTTIAAGASRLLALHPGSQAASLLLTQSIKVIGSLVKYIAHDAVVNKSVPGLAAMRPQGEFIADINRVPVDRTRPAARSYYAIGSDFEPNPEDPAGSLGKRMALKIADGVIDRLMGKSNDLVVHRDSMLIIDPVPSAKLLAKMPFDQNAEIYHTVYFHQPQIARQCAEWLGLAASEESLIKRPPREWWPEEVSRDFSTLPAEMKVGVAAKILRNSNERFVVLERPYRNGSLHYGLPRDELSNVLKNVTHRDASLLEALDMRESNASDITMTEALSSESSGRFRNITESMPPLLPGGNSHAVIVDNNITVGVANPPAATAPERVPTLSPAAVTLPVDQSIWCYAHATMPEQAVLNKKATVEVTLSREKIEFITNATSGIGGGKVSKNKNLIVQIQARKHCVVNGESRIEVPVPEPGSDAQLFFDVTPKHAGDGEVRVIVRQGSRAIAQLKLYPQFVASTGDTVVSMTAATADLIPSDNRREVKNTLYITEALEGNTRALDFLFEYQIDGQQLIVKGRSRPFSDEQVRIDYIKGLYRDIEDFWAKSDAEYQSFMFSLRARGAEIFKKLVPSAVQKVLWEHRDKLNAIQVFSDEPSIPWELAYLVEPSKPATLTSHFLAEKGVVRGYTKPEGITRLTPTKLRLRKGHFAHVIPEYPAASRIGLPGAQRERALLEKNFGAVPIKPDKTAVLSELMQQNKFDILHFACHGEANTDDIWNANLLMQGRMDDQEYRRDRLQSTDIAGFANLRSTTSPGPLVFLNACQVGRTGYSLTGNGGFANAFMEAGAGAFIGTHWNVGDGSALEFSRTFYQEFLAGKNIMAAVKAARQAAKNKEEVSWLSYVVYADPYAKLEVE